MIVNSNWAYPSDMKPWIGYEYDNSTYVYWPKNYYYALSYYIFKILNFLICCAGFLGNGATIWLLSFCTKKTQFTTYILNLAVADFAFLMTLEMVLCVYLPFAIEVDFLMFAYNTRLLLLTAIGIDRCVSVLFPIWHRCHQPTHLSITVCSLIWVLSLLFSTILLILQLSHGIYYDIALLLSSLLCITLVTISAVILFIQICFKSQQQKRRRALMVILLTLLFFLVLAFPLTAFIAPGYFLYLDILNVANYTTLAASLNSSVNPLIYFLVGRKKGAQSRQSLKVILQRALNEEEENKQERDCHISNPLMNCT